MTGKQPTAILVDAGNTRVRAVAWEASGPASPLVELGQRPAPDDGAAAGECARWLADLVDRHGTRPVVLVSVVPDLTEAVAAGIANLTVVDHRSSLPFESAVPDLAAVGADRLCNMAAARAVGLHSALVVDAGTATTFDVLVDGVFAGGLIAPGMAFSAQQLGLQAARLEPVPFEPAPLEPGTDTATAMAAGAWHVGRGGVESVIAGLQNRYPGIAVVVTGGLGRHLTASDRHLDPDWCLRGAAFLAGF